MQRVDSIEVQFKSVLTPCQVNEFIALYKTQIQTSGPQYFAIDPTNLNDPSKLLHSYILRIMLAQYRKKDGVVRFHKGRVFHKLNGQPSENSKENEEDRKSKEYYVYLPDPKNPQQFVKHAVTLTHSLFYRSKPFLKNNIKVPRYSIISNNKRDLLGNGGFGEVWRSIGTLTEKRNGSLRLKNKRHAVKVAYIKKAAEKPKKQQRITLIRDESAFSLRAEHLSSKPVVFEKDIRIPKAIKPASAAGLALEDLNKSAAYIAMKELPGIELLNFMNSNIQKFQPFETARAARSLGIALINEAHQLDIVHRDLKPENVLLDVSNVLQMQKVALHLLDYGLAIVADKHNTLACGSQMWQALDVLAHLGASKKSDAYTYGLMLIAMFFGKVRGDFAPATRDQELIPPQGEIFTRLGEFLQVDKSGALHAIMRSLLSPVKAARMDVATAVEELWKIELELVLQSVPRNHQTNARAAIELAHNQGRRADGVANKLKNSAEPLTELKVELLQCISDLDDTYSQAVDEFIYMANIKAFFGSQTKLQLQNKVITSIDNFQWAFEELMNLQAKLQAKDIVRKKMALLIPDYARLRDEIDDMFDEVQSLVNKPAKPKYRISLDNLEVLTAKLTKGIKQVREMDAHIDAQTAAPLVRSYTQIMNRLECTAASLPRAKVVNTLKQFISAQIQENVLSEQPEKVMQLLTELDQKDEQQIVLSHFSLFTKPKAAVNHFTNSAPTLVHQTP